MTNLVPGHMDWRPDWWVVEMEPLLKFVREFRDTPEAIAIQSGELQVYESENGEYLFVDLPKAPEFTAPWRSLTNPDFRQTIFARIHGQPDPVTKADTWLC